MKTSLLFYCILFLGILNSCNISDKTNKSQSTANSTLTSLETSSDVKSENGSINLDKLVSIGSNDNKIFSIKDTSMLKFYAHINTYKTNQIDTFSNVNDYIALVEGEHNTFYLIRFKAAKVKFEAETGATFDHFYTATDIKPKYIFEGIYIDQDYRINGSSIGIDIMTIGEYIEYNLNREDICIYALGAVELDNESTSSLPIKMIKDYEVHIRTSYNYIITDTILFTSSKVIPDIANYDNGLGIDWVGDLNGDGKCDLVGLRRNHYTHRGYSLYISSIKNDKTQIAKICDYDISAD
jgi:hypothetical protein